MKLAVKETLRRSSIDGAVSLLWSTLLFSYKIIPNQNLLYGKILPEKKWTVLVESFFIQANIAIRKAHILDFEALAYVLPLFDPLTDVVIRVFIFQTFAEVCYSAFVKRSSFKRVLNLRKAYIFKSLLKVYYRSVFNESSKAFIFQKFAESLHPAWNFPLIKPSVVPRSKFTDEMWSSASVVPQSKSTELCS